MLKKRKACLDFQKIVGSLALNGKKNYFRA